MTPQELKNSILQRAIQGRLVEQRPEEGTGEELYREIQAEKQRLIRAGKLKKEKPLPEIAEDEIPFDIPESWKWVRLKDAVYSRGQAKPNGTFSYVDIGSIDNINQCLNETETIIEASKAPSRARRIIAQGDILYSTVRPYLHNMCIVDRQFSYQPIASTGFAAMTCFDGVINRYLFYYLLSPDFDKYANSVENAKGVAYPAINDNRLYRAVFPLPPIAEQRRIVAKIEELLPHVERYTKAWNRLETFSKRFPSDMRKSLLQLAIHGRLVEQRPDEGTGEELYREIQVEKRCRIQAGELKREKPLPEISEDEIPFEIPESWKWVRFSDIAKFENGDRSSRYPVESDYVPVGIPFFGAKDMDRKYMSFNDVRYISEEKFNSLGNGKLCNNDFVCLLRGSVGKCALFRADDYHQTGFICAQMVIIRCIDTGICEYIFALLRSGYYEKYVAEKTTGTAVRQLPAKELSRLPVPLPPLKEQRRIVERLEEMLPLCEKLE